MHSKKNLATDFGNSKQFVKLVKPPYHSNAIILPVQVKQQLFNWISSKSTQTIEGKKLKCSVLVYIGIAIKSTWVRTNNFNFFKFVFVMRKVAQSFAPIRQYVSYSAVFNHLHSIIIGEQYKSATKQIAPIAKLK